MRADCNDPPVPNMPLTVSYTYREKGVCENEQLLNMDFSGTENGQLNEVSFELLNWAIPLAEKQQPLTALVFGDQLSDTELQKLIQRGADRVLHVSVPAGGFSAGTHYCLMELINRETEIPTRQQRQLDAPCPMPPGNCALTDGGLHQTRYRTRKRIVAANRSLPVATLYHHQNPGLPANANTVRPHARNRPAAAWTSPGQHRAMESTGGVVAQPHSRVAFTPSTEERGVQDADVVLAAGRLQESG